MSYRNRYHVGGANGLIKLSVPLQSGRDQRTTMKDVQISNTDKWQLQHWRTITSVYKRTPYFEYYEHELKGLFETHYQHLADFNITSIHWLKAQLKIQFEETMTETFTKSYGAGSIDLRNLKPANEKTDMAFPEYQQIFEDRIGFLPGLSALDLLFSEGPHAGNWIRMHKGVLMQWSKAK